MGDSGFRLDRIPEHDIRDQGAHDDGQRRFPGATALAMVFKLLLSARRK